MKTQRDTDSSVDSSTSETSNGKKEYATARGISIAIKRIANEVEVHHCERYESYGRMVTIGEAITNFPEQNAIEEVRMKYENLKRAVDRVPRVVRYPSKVDRRHTRGSFKSGTSSPAKRRPKKT